MTETVIETTKKPTPPYQKIVEAYHEQLPTLPQVYKLSEQRKLRIKTLWADELDDLGSWGKEKALAAAKAVDGTAIFPIFAPDEQGYPDNLESVTPLTARSCGLTEDQQAAITKMKRYTDFNDLVTNSVLGREGVERQVRTRVNNIIESQKEQLLAQQRQEQKQDEFENFKQPRKVIKM